MSKGSKSSTRVDKLEAETRTTTMQGAYGQDHGESDVPAQLADRDAAQSHTATHSARSEAAVH